MLVCLLCALVHLVVRSFRFPPGYNHYPDLEGSCSVLRFGSMLSSCFWWVFEKSTNIGRCSWSFDACCFLGISRRHALLQKRACSFYSLILDTKTKSTKSRLVQDVAGCIGTALRRKKDALLKLEIVLFLWKQIRTNRKQKSEQAHWLDYAVPDYSQAFIDSVKS